MNNIPLTAKINKSAFTRKLGLKFAGRILALMDGLNRLNSLWHLMALNDRDDKNRTSVRWNRNHYNVITLSMGLLQEIYIRISEMSDMKVVKRNLKISSKIQELVDIFEKPVLLDLLRLYRNQLSFHIDIGNICMGIDEIKDKSVDLVVSDTGKEADTIYKFAYQATLSGFVKANEIYFERLINPKSPTKLDALKLSSALEILWDYLFDVHTNTMKKIADEFIPLLINEFDLALTAP